MSAPTIVMAPIDASGEPCISSVHHLPCKIDYTGSAPVSTYFDVQPDSDVSPESDAKDSSFLESRFRGRVFKGKEVALPAKMRGVVVKESAAPNGQDIEENDRFWGIKSYFSKITIWKHDYKPTKHDHIPRTLQWVDVSRAIHDP